MTDYIHLVFGAKTSAALTEFFLLLCNTQQGDKILVFAIMTFDCIPNSIAFFTAELLDLKVAETATDQSKL